MDIIIETIFRVSEDPVFYYEISEDGDGLGLVSLSYVEDKHKKNITMTPKVAKMVAEKIIEMVKILDKTPTPT